jgi:hypothetical protein
MGQLRKLWCSRGEAGSRARMGQAMEVNEFQKALVDEALFLRGQIIAGYSMVEYVLADVAVRLDLKFPYLIKDRIKAAKEIADRQGYEPYRHDIHRVCDELLRYDDLRNFMAHGIMSLKTDNQFELRRFERHRKAFRRRTLELSVEDLRRSAGEINKYTQDAYAVFKKFYLEQAVETFDHPDDDDA